MTYIQDRATKICNIVKCNVQIDGMWVNNDAKPAFIPLFSQLGKLADRAMYFTFRNFFFF